MSRSGRLTKKDIGRWVKVEWLDAPDTWGIYLGNDGRDRRVFFPEMKGRGTKNVYDVGDEQILVVDEKVSR